MGRALRELDIQLLSHLPGNAQAKGKTERFFRFLQGRVLAHNRAESLEELQAWNLSSPLQDEWIEAYNARHLNRDTGCTPAERLEPSAVSAGSAGQSYGRSADVRHASVGGWAQLAAG